jgi:hypothetical protein
VGTVVVSGIGVVVVSGLGVGVVGTGVVAVVSGVGLRGFLAAAASAVGDVMASEQAETPSTANVANGKMARVTGRAKYFGNIINT